MNAPIPLVRCLICLVGEQRIDKRQSIGHWQLSPELLYALPDRLAQILIAVTLQALG